MPLKQWVQLILKLKQPKVDAVIVGGFVRNVLLGIYKTDLDIAVSSNSLKLARDFAKAIKGVYVLLDEAHGCARIVKKIDGIAYTVDFSDYRAKRLADDLALRDFTINSLTIPITPEFNPDNLLNGIVDANGGLKDLKAKRIVANGSGVFVDDPLRLMRAFSLSAQLGFTIEPTTLTLIKKHKDLLTQSASERVREELFKILESPRASVTLRLMDEIGLLAIVMPQVEVMRNVEQGGYHHLDVWQHSLLVVEEIENVIAAYATDDRIVKYLNEEIGGAHSRGALLKLACLWHDIGKPETKKHDGSRFTFHTHEIVGTKIVRHMCHQMRLTVKERYFLEDMVKMHLRPGYLANFDKPSAKAMYRYLRDTKQEAVTLSLLAMADQRATKGKLTTRERDNHHLAICQSIIEAFYTPSKMPDKTKRLLTGNDLIKTLKLKPSPLFAKILTAVNEAHALGKIKTKKEALAFAKTMVKK